METVSTYEVTTANDGFKSYYVVWKRSERRRHSYAGKKFKSYYVVWKLANLGRIIPVAIGLNRTM